MENYPIKSVAFGGFDKQDVIRYIEQMSKTGEAAQKELADECEALRAESASRAAALTALEAEKTALEARVEELETALAAAKAQLEALTPLAGVDQRAAALESELARIRPDAENYAQFRSRLGAIECEARERSDALERATRAQLLTTTQDYRAQYDALMTAFESAAAYVTAELRKVEVNLSQLPRAMDRPGAELAALEKQLKEE